jgi:4-amino-4-deoxy-L-arabinose transferase-like glycosyltransferase
LFVLLLLTAIMAAARLHTYDELLEMDGATYAVMAREMRAGKDLYTDVWDHKPPAVYATYYVGQLIAGEGSAHAYLLGLSAAFITLLGVYFVAAQAAGSVAGLAAAAFWAIVSTDLLLQANQPNAEAFINACLIWALALLMRMPIERVAFGRALAVGAVLALASLYKHVAIVTAAALVVAHVVATGFHRRGIVQASVIVAAAVAGWVAVLGYFAATDRYDVFVDTVVTFNQAYAGSLWNNLTEGLQPDRLAPTYILPLWPLVVPIPVLLLSRRGPISRRAAILFSAYALSTIIAIALPGRFFAHYYQLWLPILCVLAACGIAVLQKTIARPLVFPGFTVAVASLLAFMQLQNFGRPPEEWSRLKFGQRLLMSQRAAQLIDHLLAADEKFFQWGHHPELYYYSGRRPAGGELRSRHLFEGPRRHERAKRLLRDLQTNQPELVVLVAGHAFPPTHRVPRWIMDNYEQLPPPCDQELVSRFTFFGRRDGRIQTQTQKQSCLRAD